MTTVYLGLGSNQGRRLAHLQTAVDGLDRYEGVRVTAASPVYETEAHTTQSQAPKPPYLNAVLRVETSHSPETLLRIAQEMEQAEGRQQDEQRWASRPLDIDLLAFGTKVRNDDELIVPHPRLAERRFVLRPWADLEPNFVVPPPFDRSVQALLTQCSDTCAVEKTAHELALPHTASHER